MNGPLSGLMLIGAAVMLVEAWRRGYLRDLTASITAAAKGTAAPRPFRLPTASAWPESSYVGNGGMY